VTAVRRAPPATAVAATLVAALAVLPLAYLVLRASEVGLGTAGELVLNGRTVRLLRNSLGLAAATTATAIAIGVPVAWLTTRTDLPGRRLLTVLTALPLAVPSYVAALAVTAAFGPRGAVARWLGPLGVEALPEVYGFVGAWLALSLSTFPYVTLTVRGALRRLDPALEDVSRSLGSGSWETFRRVTLPQLRPAVAAGGLLVALYTLADFGGVSLLRFDTFTRVIYGQYRGSLDRSGAAVLALVLAAVSLSVVAVEVRTRSRARVAAARSARTARTVALGRWRTPALSLLVMLVIVALAVPVATLVTWLVLGAREGIDLGDTAGAAGRSARVAAGARWPPWWPHGRWRHWPPATLAGCPASPSGCPTPATPCPAWWWPCRWCSSAPGWSDPSTRRWGCWSWPTWFSSCPRPSAPCAPPSARSAPAWKTPAARLALAPWPQPAGSCCPWSAPAPPPRSPWSSSPP